jgi:hypothetical protein
VVEVEVVVELLAQLLNTGLDGLCRHPV